MWVRGFLSSLVLGAGIAVASVFAAHLLGPFLGVRSALGLHLAIGLVVYVVAIAERPREALRNGLLGALGGALVLACAGSPIGVAVGLTGWLAVVRSGLDPARRNARGLAVEAGLAIGSLAFAAMVFSPGVLGFATAVWGYALGQSTFFLISVSGGKAKRVGEVDPFDRARDQLVALLGEARSDRGGLT